MCTGITFLFSPLQFFCVYLTAQIWDQTNKSIAMKSTDAVVAKQQARNVSLQCKGAV
jgi:hypothetical protein